jgi:hypothetical protein
MMVGPQERRAAEGTAGTRISGPFPSLTPWRNRMRAILRLIERSCPVLLVMFALACSDDGPTGDSQLCGGVRIPAAWTAQASASKCPNKRGARWQSWTSRHSLFEMSRWFSGATSLSDTPGLIRSPRGDPDARYVGGCSAAEVATMRKPRYGGASGVPRAVESVACSDSR